MRIAIESNALYTTRAGMARYVRGLLGGLRQVADPQEWEWVELAWPVENFEFRQPRRAWRTFYREFVWAHLLAVPQLRREQTALLHTTATQLFNPPRELRHVVTIHDVGFLRFPERFRTWHRRAATRALERSRHADRLLCISRFTADELVRLARFDHRRIHVVPIGCTLLSDASEEPIAMPLPGEFLLFVGSLEPGKNLALLHAVYELASARGWTLPDLVIVGARFAGLASEGPPPSGWHYLGHLPDPGLVWLYRRAIALVFPSKYEGFGLPVAEAMNLNCPVICSPVSSLPEVAGEAALMTAQEPQAYLAAIRRLLDEPGLREQLAARGRQHARQFTWERCARETLEVYREVSRS